MEKQGIVRPGKTPDTEGVLDQPGVKSASKESQVDRLDNDLSKRAADKVAETLKPPRS